jgi:hypothetical protein
MPISGDQTWVIPDLESVISITGHCEPRLATFNLFCGIAMNVLLMSLLSGGSPFWRDVATSQRVD